MYSTSIVEIDVASMSKFRNYSDNSPGADVENLASLRVRDLEAGDGQLHEPLLLQVEGDGGAHRDLLVQGELGRDGEGAALHQRDGERLHVDADQSEMSTVDVDIQ